MTDIRSEPAGPAELPEPIVHTPGEGELPPRVARAETTVLLLAGRVDGEWAAETAVELCRAWAAAGRRVVLADLHLENPRLHERLGVENLEGIVDVFLYGASISRSAKPVPEHGFYLIPAGTYDADAAAIYRHPRWAKLVAGFRDAGASLVLFAPAEAAELEAIAGWIGQVVLLGAPLSGELPPGLVNGAAPQPTLLVPPGYRAPRREEEAVEVTSFVPAAPSGPERELILPPAPVRRPPPRRGTLKAFLVFLLVAVLLAAAGFALAFYRPDLVPWLTGVERPPAEAETFPAATAPASTAVRVGAPVPFAVLVRSYASLGAARQQVQDEERRFAGTPFYISPEDDSGVLYFKVYAGLLRDTASAERLREQLVQAGAVDSDDTLGALSLIHRAHLAFDLGEFATREAAAEVRDSLAAREIPTYPVAMPYDDGTRRWQLYGGAYRDSVAADAMRRRLAGAGMTPRLVLRMGEPSPAPAPAQ